MPPHIYYCESLRYTLEPSDEFPLAVKFYRTHIPTGQVAELQIYVKWQLQLPIMVEIYNKYAAWNQVPIWHYTENHP